ncbi:hypothetical protein TCSYLVIO_007968 [Trypanosoma cruzi]|nr:hypothetical protein TCSYLVIO_007968 [Trypanosoma cruzi]
MVGAFVVVVVVVVFGFISISALLSTCPTMIESGERNEPGSSSETSSVVSAGAAGPGLVGVLDDTAVAVPLFTFSLGVMSVSVSVCPTISVTHTDGQQHKASTNRAHSRRHVVIIVSVVVQWCGADLHSEGNGEQQGRREVQQTHTEGTPHEERAAARHAPYAAHNARHTLQSTAAGTHTQPCRNTNTQMEEGEANRSGTQGSTACTYGESGPSCRHPSRRVRTHMRRRSAHSNTKAR